MDGERRLRWAFKGYDKAARGTFIIFDALDVKRDAFMAEEQWRAELAKEGLEPYFVKLLAVLDHPSAEDVLAVAKRNDFLLEGTDMVGEGVVCKVPGWVNKFGRAVYGKIVLSEFKKQRKPSGDSASVEPDIIEAHVTDAEIEKTMAKVCTMVGATDFDAESRKMMGMLASLCWRDLLTECPNWVKKLKNPTVDFGVLSGMCSKRVTDFAKSRNSQ